MRLFSASLHAGVLLVWLLTTSATHAELAPTALRCEHLVEPLGVGLAQPELSWQVTSSQRNQQQSAYQVIVSSSAEKLFADQGDLWDSGKVASSATYGITYAGRALENHQLCYWKVKVWDRADVASVWSPAATWSVGLLSPSAWTATWIGADELRTDTRPPADLTEAKWIGPSDVPSQQAPAGKREYTASVELSKVPVTEALVTYRADDSADLYVNGLEARHAVGEPTVVDITHLLQAGKNDLRFVVNNSSPGPTGLIAQVRIEQRGAKETVNLATSEGWQVTGADSKPVPCKVIGSHNLDPWGPAGPAIPLTPPAVRLRKTFELPKAVRRATLYSAALGDVELWLNNQRVTDDYFPSGWTDYSKRVYYRAYDVTKLLTSGANAWGAVLADGWYSGHIGFAGARDYYGKRPRFAGQLVLEFEDGATQVITTSGDWKAAAGPVLRADLLHGETYDARLADPKWSSAEYDDAKWQAVSAGAEVSPQLQWHPGPPVRVVEKFQPVKITEPRPGIFVADLGQNFAGVIRAKVRGTEGTKITFRYAERLNPDGTVYVTNLRGAQCTDAYICKGAGLEEWSPRFTFHGFQYVEIRGLKNAPKDSDIVGLALSSDTPVASKFSSSDSQLNRLHKNIFWTQRANFIDIPTDCPQRDERLGWTGDAQVYIATAALNCDVQAFFNKWLVDLADAQRADGQFPMVAPLKVAGDDGGPAWADAGVICPWTTYEVYGDKRLLARQYPSMKKFVEFCRRRSVNGVLPPQKFHCFGDWLNINAETPTPVIYTAYYALSTKLLARAAEALGNSSDAKNYNDLFARVKAAFNQKFVKPDGRIEGDTQCGYVLALGCDLLDAERQKLAAEYLVGDVEARGNHLSTGFVGTKDLMLVLAKIGRHDVAYKLLHQDTFPSWLFSIKHGATSIWERWNGWTPEQGFGDPGMNSFAHYSFGAVYQFMVENIGGIRRDKPGYEHFLIEPHFDPALQYATVRYDSIRGPIVTSWNISGENRQFEITIPANSTAELRLPTPKASEVTESDRSLAEVIGVSEVVEKDGKVIATVGSGSYKFAFPSGVKPQE